MEQSSTNIYVSLQRLVWSTFVGVISFQIIAPNVWNYVNKMLGIEYQDGYTVFVIIYAITLPIIILIWLFTHWSELKACLFPIDNENETTRLCTVFRRGLGLTTSFQLITIFILLICYSITPDLFLTVQLSLVSLSVTLLGFGAVISWERIRCFTNDNRDSASIKVKNRAWRILITWVLLAISLALFGIFHWKHNSENYVLEKKNEVKNSFSMLKKRDSLDLLLQDVQAYHTAVLYKNNNLNLVAVKKQKIDSPKKELDKVHVNDVLFEFKVATSLKNDSLKNLDSIYHKIENILVAQKDLTLKKAQIGLGKRLRDNQLKITYLLLNVFLILISLYVFLKVDFIIKEHEYQKSKRLHDLKQESIRLKTEMLKRDDKRINSMKISGDVWLYITIAIWLLVPLFKPIEDSKIDTAAPFKMLTFGDGVDRFIGNTSNDENVRIDNSFNTDIDSIVFRLQETYEGDTHVTQADLRKIEALLSSLKEQVQIIEQDTELIKSILKPRRPSGNNNK